MSRLCRFIFRQALMRARASVCGAKVCPAREAGVAGDLMMKVHIQEKPGIYQERDWICIPQ